MALWLAVVISILEPDHLASLSLPIMIQEWDFTTHSLDVISNLMQDDSSQALAQQGW